MSRSLVDTNILVYCYDGDEPAKRARALALLADDATELVVSTQVLQEFYVAVTRKLARPLSAEDAERALQALATLPTVPADRELVLAAVALSHRHRLSLWDALIIRAAADGGCDTLLTEDLQDGATFDGVRIRNPLL